jgi:integrase
MRGQIIKRGERTWLVRVPLGRDATGKRRTFNKTVKGTKKQAQEYLAEILHKQSRGDLVERNREPVADYLRRWITTIAVPRVRARTAEDYRSIVEAHLVPAFGSLQLSQLTVDAIQRLYAEMGASGLSPRTVRYVHSVLNSALAHAVRVGQLARNPAALATLPRNRRREMRAMSPADASRFLNAAAGDRFEALWCLLLTGGLRPGEALALQWTDLDGDTVRVQRSLVRLRGGTWAFDEPKTARARRSVLLPAGAVALLRLHKAKQNESRLSAGSRWTDHGLVFCTATGEPLEWRVISRRYLRPILSAVGIQALRPYDLRHSCATLLLASGENPKVVSERLGHSSVALTSDVYSHVLPDMQQKAAEQLERMLFPTARAGYGR